MLDQKIIKKKNVAIPICLQLTHGVLAVLFHTRYLCESLPQLMGKLRPREVQ